MLFQFLKTQEGNRLLLFRDFIAGTLGLTNLILFRDFTGGTLGLAWVASASGASGGICEKYKTYAENINGINHKAKRSLNTGRIFCLLTIFKKIFLNELDSKKALKQVFVPLRTN